MENNNDFLTEISHLEKAILEHENRIDVHCSFDEFPKVTNAVAPLFESLNFKFEVVKKLFIDYIEDGWTETKNIGQIKGMNMENWRGQLFIKKKTYSFYNYRIESKDFSLHLEIGLIFNKYDWMLNFIIIDNLDYSTYPCTPLRKKYSDELQQDELDKALKTIEDKLLFSIKHKLK